MSFLSAGEEPVSNIIEEAKMVLQWESGIDLGFFCNTKTLESSAVSTPFSSQKPKLLAFLNRKAACDLADRYLFSSCTAEIYTQLSKPNHWCPYLFLCCRCGYSRIGILIWKKSPLAKKQFCLRTTFIEFADKVPHGSFFSSRGRKKS